MCVKLVFLLAEYFSLPLFCGCGLLGHAEAPRCLVVSAEGALQLEVSSLRSERLLFRTEEHFKLMAHLQ